MRRTPMLVIATLTSILIASGCGGTDTTTGDAATDDAGPGDSPDLVDIAVDPSPDTAIDTVVDTTPDSPDNDCVEAGGYCTEYPVIPDSCVTCDSTGEVHFRPAHNPLGAMGCTVEGVGGSPWCCLPHESGTTDCETGGGECYPYADPEPCPPGWGMIWSDCGGGEGIACCAPASVNCD